MKTCSEYIFGEVMFGHLFFQFMFQTLIGNTYAQTLNVFQFCIDIACLEKLCSNINFIQTYSECTFE